MHALCAPHDVENRQRSSMHESASAVSDASVNQSGQPEVA